MKKKIFNRMLISSCAAVLFLYTIFLISPLFLCGIANKFIPQIKDEVKKSTGLVLDIDKIKPVTNYRLNVGAEVKGVKLSFPNGENVVSSDRAGVRLSLFPLILKKIELSKIYADNMTADLGIEKDGKFSIEKIIPKSENDENTSQIEPLPFGLKLSNKLPDIKLNGYEFAIVDIAKNKNYSLSGDNIAISDFILDKKIRVKADGKINLDGENHFNYDVKVLNRVMPNLNLNDIVFASSSSESSEIKDINAGKIMLDILEGIHKNGITSNIKADIKTSGTLKDISVLGNADIENIGLNVYGKPLPKGFIKIRFKNQDTVADSKIYTSLTDFTQLNGHFKGGKHTYIDLNLNSKANLGDIVSVFDSVLKSFNYNRLATLKATGKLDADFNLKSDLKKVSSNGYIKLNDGNVNYGLYNVSLNDIKSDIDLSNNSVNIKDTGFKIHGQPLKIYGKINEKSDCDIHLTAEDLQLKGLILAIGQTGILKENDINSGLISADVSLGGRLNNLIPDAKIYVNNVNIKNKPSDTKITLNRANVDFDTDGKTYSGKIDIDNAAINNPLTSVKAPKSLISFGQKDIIIENSSIYLNNSKIDIKGKISDYISEKINFDIKANGNLLASDIKSMVPKELGLDVSAAGSIPLTVTVTGDSKKQNISVNLKATPNGYAALLDIDALKGQNTIINSDISIADNSIKLSNTGVYKNSMSNPIIKVTGGVSDITGKQILNSVNISTPQQISMSVPTFKGSNAAVKADITFSGRLLSPAYKGNINITSANIPTLKLKSKDIGLNLSEKEISADASLITLGKTDFSGKGKISTDFSKGLIFNSLDFTSRFIDSDELISIIASMNSDASGGNGQTSGQGAQDLGITVYNGKFDITEATSGDIIAHNINSTFTLKNNIAYLNDLSLRAYDGSMAGKITYNVINSNTTLSVKGEGMNALKVIETFAGIKNAMSGKLNFNADLNLNAADEKTMMNTVKGKVNFSINDGTFLNVGTLQSFFNAQNILQNPLLKAAVSSISYLQPIKNTANFKTLSGDLSLSNGWASLGSIKSQGNSLCYYITGKYNLLNANSSIIFLGRLDEDVVALLGPVGSLSVSKLTSFIPKFGDLTAQLINAMTSNPANEKISLIPELLSGSKNYKDFKVEIIGVLGSSSSIRSFKWLSVCDTSEINMLSAKEQVKATTTAVKDAYKNQVQEVKNSIENTKQDVKNKVEAARQEVQTEANQTKNIRKNLSNIKNLQDLLKNNGATMGTGE